MNARILIEQTKISCLIYCSHPDGCYRTYPRDRYLVAYRIQDFWCKAALSSVSNLWVCIVHCISPAKKIIKSANLENQLSVQFTMFSVCQIQNFVFRAHQHLLMNENLQVFFNNQFNIMLIVFDQFWYQHFFITAFLFEY